MKKITMINKAKCYPVDIISITKTTSNNTLVIEWSNPYNMAGAVTLQYSVDGGVTYFDVQQLDVTSTTETVYSNALGNIPNGQLTKFRLVINTQACGLIAGNVIDITYIRNPVIIYERTGNVYIDYVQNTFKNWGIVMPNGFTDIITETGTYKFDITVTKSQQISSHVDTLPALIQPTSNLYLPTLTNPVPSSNTVVLGNIPQPQGTITSSFTLNLTAGTRLAIIFYHYNGGYLRLSMSANVKVTRL